MPQAKKQSRPRLDAVIRHIKAGSYDEDMSQLKGAIADRDRILQERVVAMVKQTFGEDYVVTKPTPNPTLPARRPRPGGPVDPELAEAEARARADEERLRKEAGIVEDPLGDDDEDADIESRSPIIGAIDSTQEGSDGTDGDDAAGGHPPDRQE
jgi:hypothetical protein